VVEVEEVDLLGEAEEAAEVDLLAEGVAEVEAEGEVEAVEAEAVQLNRKRTEFAGKPGLPDVIISETKYICSQPRLLLSAEEFLKSLKFFYSEIANNFCCGHDAKCRLQIRHNQKLDCNALEDVLGIVTGMGAPKRNVLLFNLQFGFNLSHVNRAGPQA
jgi:hypothetical protein